MNKLKLLFLRPFNERSKNQIFNSLGKFYELIYPNFFDDNELLKYAPIADVVLGNSVSDEFLYSTKNLKLFHNSIYLNVAHLLAPSISAA